MKAFAASTRSQRRYPIVVALVLILFGVARPAGVRADVSFYCCDTLITIQGAAVGFNRNFDCGRDFPKLPPGVRRQICLALRSRRLVCPQVARYCSKCNLQASLLQEQYQDIVMDIYDATQDEQSLPGVPGVAARRTSLERTQQRIADDWADLRAYCLKAEGYDIGALEDPAAHGHASAAETNAKTLIKRTAMDWSSFMNDFVAPTEREIVIAGIALSGLGAVAEAAAAGVIIRAGAASEGAKALAALGAYAAGKGYSQVPEEMLNTMTLRVMNGDIISALDDAAKALANDPPDPDYATLIAIGYPPPERPESTDEYSVHLIARDHWVKAQVRYLEAYRISFERLQAAKAAGDTARARKQLDQMAEAADSGLVASRRERREQLRADQAVASALDHLVRGTPTDSLSVLYDAWQGFLRSDGLWQGQRDAVRKAGFGDDYSRGLADELLDTTFEDFVFMAEMVIAEVAARASASGTDSDGSDGVSDRHWRALHSATRGVMRNAATADTTTSASPDDLQQDADGATSGPRAHQDSLGGGVGPAAGSIPIVLVLVVFAGAIGGGAWIFARRGRPR